MPEYYKLQQINRMYYNKYTRKNIKIILLISEYNLEKDTEL